MFKKLTGWLLAVSTVLAVLDVVVTGTITTFPFMGIWTILMVGLTWLVYIVGTKSSLSPVGLGLILFFFFVFLLMPLFFVPTREMVIDSNTGAVLGRGPGFKIPVLQKSMMFDVYLCENTQEPGFPEKTVLAKRVCLTIPDENIISVAQVFTPNEYDAAASEIAKQLVKKAGAKDTIFTLQERLASLSDKLANFGLYVSLFSIEYSRRD